MYLKSLEIQGFKSFADKVQFQFTPGVSAIVGPNGSGKSNVVDSIRWVLGEQSAKSLRGSKMDDVIFSGSSKRRAVGMAQVSLILDNSDGKFPLEQSEISITRRLYRSGESEYMINKSPCRLKDIHELFLDTGVGREGFSVIGQGKVDEVLSLKAEDRRGLIEEAAGIMKYKYRKKEAERRLEETTANMERLNDITYELKERLIPLGEQAEKAKSYHLWKNEMDTLALSLDLEEMTALIAQKARTEETLNSQTDQFLAAQSAVNSLDSTNIIQKKQQQEQTERYTALSETTLNWQKQWENYLAEERILKQTKEQALLRMEQIKEEKAYLSAQKEQLQAAKKDKLLKEQELAEQWQSIRQKLAKDKLEEEALAEQLNQMRQAQDEHSNNYLQFLQKQAQGNNKKSALEQKITQLGQSVKRSTEKADRLRAEQDKAKNEILAAEENLSQNKISQNDLRQEIANIAESLAEYRSDYGDMLEKEHSAQALWQKENSRLHALMELEEAGDGYQYGVKSILEAKRDGKLKGIIGTVAQVIKVPPNLERAVEVALGASLQNIITESDQDAQKAINYLKQQKKGRATFMPLNTVNGQKSKEQLTEKAVLGLACQLIGYDKKYENIINSLLGRVWIVNSLAEAVEIGKKHKFSLRLVTLDGEVISPGGTLSGGSFANNKSGILLRLRQIEELKQRVEQLKQNWQDISDKMNKLQEKLKSLNEENNILQEKNEEYIRQALIWENKIAQGQRDFKRLQGDLHLEQLEIEDTQAEISLSEEELKNIAAELDILTEKLASWSDIEESQKQLISELEQKLKQKQELRHGEELQSMQAKERLQALKEQQAETNRQIEAYDSQFQAKGEEYTLKEQELAQTEHNLLQNAQNSQQAQNNFYANKQKQEILRSKIEELKEAIENLEEQLRQKQRLAQDLQAEKFKTELEFNKINNRLESLRQNLNENYTCTYDEALLRKVEIADKEQARKTVSKLKNKIAALGNINFAAIEEFAEVEERLEFLQKQLDDLTEAKASLDQVIKEMEQIMAKKFRETYVVVNNIFSEVFATMFGGGEARLQLSNPNDYLRTGIEIVARPPGKKEQTLSLLSGGERAMTAIALLFALLNVRPSPFCVLDEIEAALDEINVERFARFIREYTKKSQFIVISHRKGTMEAADVLYGVSMENDGVSKLVSVRLEDYQ